jgi:hypothetical protein
MGALLGFLVLVGTVLEEAVLIELPIADTTVVLRSALVAEPTDGSGPGGGARVYPEGKLAEAAVFLDPAASECP